MLGRSKIHTEDLTALSLLPELLFPKRRCIGINIHAFVALVHEIDHLNTDIQNIQKEQGAVAIIIILLPTSEMCSELDSTTPMERETVTVDNSCHTTPFLMKGIPF